MVTVEEIRKVRAELERATDYYLVKEIANRALTLLEDAVDRPVETGVSTAVARTMARRTSSGRP